MNKSLIQILQLIVNDVAKNYNDFSENNLKKAISQFQNNILKLRKKDIEINSALENLSSKQIIENCNRLSIKLLSPPKPKNQIVALINALILQTGKKDDFLKLIKSVRPAKKISKPKPGKKKAMPISSEYNTVRKLWLTNKDLIDLKAELSPMNMNVIRTIVKPWNVKPNGRTKIALIDAVIGYINKMRGISKLGT